MKSAVSHSRLSPVPLTRHYDLGNWKENADSSFWPTVQLGELVRFRSIICVYRWHMRKKYWFTIRPICTEDCFRAPSLFIKRNWCSDPVSRHYPKRRLSPVPEWNKLRPPTCLDWFLMRQAIYKGKGTESSRFILPLLDGFFRCSCLCYLCLRRLSSYQWICIIYNLRCC